MSRATNGEKEYKARKFVIHGRAAGAKFVIVMRLFVERGKLKGVRSVYVRDEKYQPVATFVDGIVTAKEIDEGAALSQGVSWR